MLKAGEILDGRYEVIDVLGQGGMGIVYLCRNNRLGKLWAIKEIPKKMDSSADFSSEAILLKDLDHPGIPRVIDIFYENSNIYIVEDYIQGETIESLVNKKGPMKDIEVYGIALKLCDILEYLHSCSPPVIYRDLKPSNIMMTPEGRVYLIDFGISRTYKEYKDGDTVYMGSKGYAAPEQYGNAQSGKQTDVFGLGAVMYFMSKGADPASPIGPSRDDTYDKWANKKMKDIIQKATQLESEKRYLSIAEMKEAITCASVTKFKEVHEDRTHVIGAEDRTMLMADNTPKLNVSKPKRKNFQPPGFINKNIKQKKTVLKLAALTFAFFAVIFAVEHFILTDAGKANSHKNAASTSQTAQGTSTEQNNDSSGRNAIVQPSLPASSAEGYIDMTQPIILDSGNNPGPGKRDKQYADMGTFYAVKPQSVVSVFNNNLVIALEYVETSGNTTTAYCSINNNSGENIGISLDNTCLSPQGSGPIAADASESVVPDSIASGTGKQYVKLVFNGLYLVSGRYTITASTLSLDPELNNQNISLTFNVK